MISFIAIDPSLSRTGIYVHCNFMQPYTIKVEKRHYHKNRYSVLAELSSVVEVVCSSRNIELAVVEKYAFAARGNAMTKLAEVGGVIYASLYKKRVKIYEMASQTWKLLTLGDSRIKKQYIRAVAEEDYEELPETQDELDAFLMGQAVLMAFDSSKQLVRGSASYEKSLLKLKNELEVLLNEDAG